MNKRDQTRYTEIETKLLEFHNRNISLPGILNANQRNVFIKQILDSMRRIEYVYAICQRNINQDRSDPATALFDPIKAAIYQHRQGNIDEAFWLIFLSINYGKHLTHGWRMVREVYGELDSGNIWTWGRVSTNPDDFTNWITANYKNIISAFGNHRKYESLRPDAQRSPAEVVTSYIHWVGDNHSHLDLIIRFQKECNSDSRLMFSKMYRSLNSVVSFGRTTRFDYLTMVAKLGLINIVPDATYMQGATGPYSGANLLFTGNLNTNSKKTELERQLILLEDKLPLGNMGMQVLEDALCNWQKAPRTYRLFKG
ncbi:MAG: hypothetical protein QM500_12005 [Methylococcales bacterium]